MAFSTRSLALVCAVIAWAAWNAHASTVSAVREDLVVPNASESLRLFPRTWATPRSVVVFDGEPLSESTDEGLGRGGGRAMRARGGRSRVVVAPTYDLANVLEHVRKRGFYEQRGRSDAGFIWVRVGLPSVPTSDWPIEANRALRAWQIINRLPRLSTELNQKDAFALHVRAAEARFGTAEFGFHPESFVLPRDLDALRAATAAVAADTPFIAKPVFGGRGIGIRVHSAADVVSRTPADGEWIVQRYIPNPLLVGGRKFSLRIYVLVTSVAPLVAYVHTEGIAKFAAQPFGAKSDAVFFDADAIHMHITNNALNAEASSLSTSPDPSVDAVGLRRSLRAIRAMLAAEGYDSRAVFARVEDVLLKSLILVEPAVADALAHVFGDRPRATRPGMFNILGVDVDLTDTLAPIVIEANVNPSLGVHAAFEQLSKDAMLSALFDMTGVTAYNTSAVVETVVKPFLRAHRTCGVGALAADARGCLPAGDDDALAAIAQFEVEQAHARGFRRMYPRAESWEHYQQFFSSEHRLDRLLGDYVSAFHAADAHAPNLFTTDGIELVPDGNVREL